MNPRNILREFRKMYEPQADDKDRRIVAEEMLAIFADQPVLKQHPERYRSNDDVTGLLTDAVTKSKKEGNADGQDKSGEKQEKIFFSKASLIHSFVSELDHALDHYFLQDSFDWLLTVLAASPPQGETPEAREALYVQIERVCRDVLSVAYDDSWSLESLFHLYRHMTDGSMPPYDFLIRLRYVKDRLLALPQDFRFLFTIAGATANASHVTGRYGKIVISDTAPQTMTGAIDERLALRYASRDQRLFAEVTLQSRDGRSAGMIAYRHIGEILDLMRFEFDSKNLMLSTQFLLEDSGKVLQLQLPGTIPNPEAEPPSRSLEDFVKHLNGLATRHGAHAESRDRIFAAFRLYRAGTSARIFENKLVNWWTAIEYLTKPGKSSGIGDGVEAALAPTLGLIYVSKHLKAYHSMLTQIDAELQIDGVLVKVRDLALRELFTILKDVTHKPALQSLCEPHPYLWHHLQEFMGSITSLAMIGSLLKSHEGRVRSQIQRIYRARCDIVHNGQHVAMAGLLCANLEYYLRMTLKSMLQSFQDVPTMLSPGEFFERRRHQYDRMMKQLEAKNGATDALLLATLS